MSKYLYLFSRYFRLFWNVLPSFLQTNVCHYVSPQYSALCYTALHCKIHITALHCTTTALQYNCTAVECNARTILQYSAQRYINTIAATVVLSTSLQFDILHLATLHCSVYYCTALHCTALHCAYFALSVAALHCSLPW